MEVQIIFLPDVHCTMYMIAPHILLPGKDREGIKQGVRYHPVQSVHNVLFTIYMIIFTMILNNIENLTLFSIQMHC